MKKGFFKLFWMVVVSIIVGGCETIYFSTPQPYNAKNIYEFPKEMRGLWVIDEDTILIDKNYFIYKEYKQTHSIAKKELDTSSIYILKNNKIYIKKKYEDISLSEGFPYRVHNDSVYFNARQVIKVALSYDTFLRKIDEDYILNTSNTTTWWMLYLIRKTADNKLNVSTLKESDLKKSDNFDTIFVADDGLFIDAQWNTVDLKKIIQKGGFSAKILELDLKDKKTIPKN